MPLKRCSNNGNSGWKYGDSGKCYTGPGAKKKAIKQGIAIDGDKFAEKASVEEINQLIDECYIEQEKTLAEQLQNILLVRYYNDRTTIRNNNNS